MPMKRKLRSRKHKRHTLKYNLRRNKKTKNNLRRNKKTKRNLPRNKKTKRKRGGSRNANDTYSLNNNRGKCKCTKTGVENGKQIANCVCGNNQIINRGASQNANNKRHNSAKGNQNINDEYLKAVRVKYRDQEAGSIDVDLKNILLNPSIINFQEAEKNIKTIVSQQAKGQTYKWIKCTDNCGKTLKTELEKEFASTAFMLRILTNSIIKGGLDQDANGLIFKIKDYSELTGIWEKDKGYIDMEPVDEKPKRLIMGFGPSASGKTFWAKHLIDMLKTDDFPDTFMSIDGGLIREYSHIYQSILNSTPSNIMGFANLAGGKKLANTSPIKTNIEEYLKLQKSKNNDICPISIYVPETLARCQVKLNCEDRYKRFIQLTGDDKWIGVYIWQHKYPEEATKMMRPPCEEGFKCVGSVNSGKKREKDEGKIYSSSYYDISEKYGIREMKKGRGGRIDIHNSGGRTINGEQQKSIITEYSINGDYILTERIVEPSKYIKKTGKQDQEAQIISNTKKRHTDANLLRQRYFTDIKNKEDEIKNKEDKIKQTETDYRNQERKRREEKGFQAKMTKDEEQDEEQKNHVLTLKELKTTLEMERTKLKKIKKDETNQHLNPLYESANSTT